MPQHQTQLKSKERTDTIEPKQYQVIIHNDDFTTMDFVVMLLKTIFFMSEEKAVELMLEVHESGKGVVGIYPYDIAMSKAQKATKMALEQNFPLRLTVEPV